MFPLPSEFRDGRLHERRRPLRPATATQAVDRAPAGCPGAPNYTGS